MFLRQLSHYTLLAAALTSFATNVWANEDRWIRIDTAAHTLSVFRGQSLDRTYPRVALGRGGAANERQSGDGVTPTGEFRIVWINRSSTFDVFFGLNFPNEEHVERAYQRHLIDIDTYYVLHTALTEGRLPPQDTPLGGTIGIHGLGGGDIAIHRKFDWTKGCIALTNEEIEQLAQWVEVGTRVVIR
ncbi:YkuD domain-containing protein [Gammaproteobacteria bacterium]